MGAESSLQTRTMILVQGIWRMKKGPNRTAAALRPAKIPLTPLSSWPGNETGDGCGETSLDSSNYRPRGLFLNSLA